MKSIETLRDEQAAQEAAMYKTEEDVRLVAEWRSLDKTRSLVEDDDAHVAAWRLICNRQHEIIKELEEAHPGLDFVSVYFFMDIISK